MRTAKLRCVYAWMCLAALPCYLVGARRRRPRQAERQMSIGESRRFQALAMTSHAILVDKRLEG